MQNNNKIIDSLELERSNETIIQFVFDTEIHMLKRLVAVQDSLRYISPAYCNSDIDVFYNEGYNTMFTLKFYKLRDINDVKDFSERAYAIRLCLDIKGIPVRIEDLARIEHISDAKVKEYRKAIEALKRSINTAKETYQIWLNQNANLDSENKI